MSEPVQKKVDQNQNEENNHENQKDNQEVTSVTKKEKKVVDTSKGIRLTFCIFSLIEIVLYAINLFVIKWDMGLNSHMANWTSPDGNLAEWNKIANIVVLVLSGISLFTTFLMGIYHQEKKHFFLFFLSLTLSLFFCVSKMFFVYPFPSDFWTSFANSICFYLFGYFLLLFLVSHKKENVFHFVTSIVVLFSEIIFLIYVLIFNKNQIMGFNSYLCFGIGTLILFFKVSSKKSGTLNKISQLIYFLGAMLAVSCVILLSPIFTESEQKGITIIALPILYFLGSFVTAKIIHTLSKAKYITILLFEDLFFVLFTVGFFTQWKQPQTERILVFSLLGARLIMEYLIFLFQKKERLSIISAVSCGIILSLLALEINTKWTYEPFFLEVILPVVWVSLVSPILYHVIHRFDPVLKVTRFVLLPLELILCAVILYFQFKGLTPGLLFTTLLILLGFILSLQIYLIKIEKKKKEETSNQESKIKNYYTHGLLGISALILLAVLCSFNPWSYSIHEVIRTGGLTVCVILIFATLWMVEKRETKKEHWILPTITILILNLGIISMFYLFHFSYCKVNSFAILIPSFVYHLVLIPVYCKDLDGSDYRYLPISASIITAIIAILVYFC